ncbi:hypothetical protein RLOC_00011916 [Lonchura striata]|uniref:Uncharacterized protein n=1 Tax=Lonchura striata TaxID=40157 RepID=A0A218VD10_9PASE|nr:hypothetical protein RLOC_00011916 [Lonchura striata domestica]
MRTYWLHSIWVLGFFLSLFSLQVECSFRFA